MRLPRVILRRASHTHCKSGHPQSSECCAYRPRIQAGVEALAHTAVSLRIYRGRGIDASCSLLLPSAFMSISLNDAVGIVPFFEKNFAEHFEASSLALTESPVFWPRAGIRRKLLWAR